MKSIVSVCVSLVLFFPLIASGGDKHKGGGGGGKAAGGGAHAANAFHGGGGGVHNMGGAKFHGGSAGTGMHAQHSLNAHQGSGHGLNTHQGAQHGLNAHAGKGLQGQHAGRFTGNRAVNKQVVNNRRVVNNRVAVHNYYANHWRAGQHWRNVHGLYYGYHRVWHDHWWWGAHYNNIVYVDGPYWGGHWYWDGGYWFPAWGYVPAYVGYVYDGPIYAYANLPPDQVVVNVQEALQDQGYYTGNIDGQLGKLTQDALASYQHDHSLEITAAIDEPTVQSLGLNTEET